MRLALVALALALPAGSSAEAPARPGAGAAAALAPICGRDMKVRPVRAGETPRLRRLDELPAGSLTLAVVNRVGDCIEPVTVRHGYGALGSR
jgi:hypothetical protein